MSVNCPIQLDRHAPSELEFPPDVRIDGEGTRLMSLVAGGTGIGGRGESHIQDYETPECDDVDETVIRGDFG